MKNQVYNPFLPSYEYVPDGEPHVFGDRVYLYGSHDRFDGKFFCMNDYVCWSAPVDDLSDWRYEGVIWRKKNDPRPLPLLLKQMYAPDVVQGYDGRYYLYYFIGNSGVLGVAVCDTPAGEYKYYGHVRYPDGVLLGKKKEKDLAQFDPGVFRDDDGRIYLYTGFGEKKPNIFTGFRAVNYNGAMGVELERDMLTIKPETMARIAKTQHCSAGTGYEGHEFFEASSMRKFNGKYYFIYSSVLGHELCYAMGDRPLGEFKYCGTLVSIGDVGLSDKPRNFLGNTHGSVEKINGEYYIFYHRQTNRHCHSRQACAEKLVMNEDGTFNQAEVTSCGLNGGPLKAKSAFSAHIAAHLWGEKGVKFYTMKTPAGTYPYFTQSGVDREEAPDQFIANFRSGSVAGFKYLEFDGSEKEITLTLRGNGEGKIAVYSGLPEDSKIVAEVAFSKDKKEKLTSPIKKLQGKHALYFAYSGKGSVDFIGFEIK